MATLPIPPPLFFSFNLSRWVVDSSQWIFSSLLLLVIFVSCLMSMCKNINMVSELKKSKELEDKLLKVRLEITEKEQEREKIQKEADNSSYVMGLCLIITIGTFFAENKLFGIIPLVITLLLFVFWSAPKWTKVGKLGYEIKLAKKKKTVRE
jgi:short subunit fatty acids transporter